MKVGAHCPISGGFTKALEHITAIGGNTLQIFSGNPRGWVKTPIEEKAAVEFHGLRTSLGVGPLVIHASYLINLVSDDTNLRKKSIAAMKEELTRADTLQADFLVVHPGSAKTADTRKTVEMLVTSIKKIDPAKYKTMLLIENTAGQGKGFGRDLDQLYTLRSIFSGDIGYCIDTAHSFEAGYLPEDVLAHPISGVTEVIHVNDSKTPLGSRVDRHEHIGRGVMGLKLIEKFINHPAWKEKPFIIETPWDGKMERENIKRLKELRKRGRNLS